MNNKIHRCIIFGTVKIIHFRYFIWPLRRVYHIKTVCIYILLKIDSTWRPTSQKPFKVKIWTSRRLSKVWNVQSLVIVFSSRNHFFSYKKTLILHCKHDGYSKNFKNIIYNNINMMVSFLKLVFHKTSTKSFEFVIKHFPYSSLICIILL